ncbi:MAG: glycosyltransferase [Burkholderiales bacterium]|nr:glycosyltransferase [Burkholderiales bacterium]
MKLLATAADIGATISAIRLAEPLRALQQERPALALRLKSFHECLRSDLAWADVLIVQRGNSRRAWRLVERMQRGGGRVVFEIDDLLTEVPASLLHHRAAQRGRPWLLRGLAAADRVSVSTERLGRALHPPPRAWSVVPNHGWAPSGGWPTAPTQPSHPSGPLRPATLLLASSDHVPVAALAAGLQRLPPARPWRLVAVGPVADDLERAGLRVERHPPRPRADFLRWARSLPDVLAVIPVGATPFDACKSAIKFFDYGLAGVPVVCADRPPYSDVVRDGRTGLLAADTPEGWAGALRRALEDRAATRSRAAAAEACVGRAHALAQTVQSWAGLLDTLAPRAAPAPPPAPLLDAMQAWALRLRRANRERLARRASRGPV